MDCKIKKLECTICKDDMLNKSLAIITTACGHIYHEDCLTKWFDRQITCPTCRRNCGELTTLYPNTIDVPTNCDEEILRQQIIDEKKDKLKIIHLCEQNAQKERIIHIKKLKIMRMKRYIKNLKISRMKQIIKLQQNLDDFKALNNNVSSDSEIELDTDE